jgi:hypothetical protein
VDETGEVAPRIRRDVAGEGRGRRCVGRGRAARADVGSNALAGMGGLRAARGASAATPCARARSTRWGAAARRAVRPRPARAALGVRPLGGARARATRTALRGHARRVRCCVIADEALVQRGWEPARTRARACRPTGGPPPRSPRGPRSERASAGEGLAGAAAAEAMGERRDVAGVVEAGVVEADAVAARIRRATWWARGEGADAWAAGELRGVARTVAASESREPAGGEGGRPGSEESARVGAKAAGERRDAANVVGAGAVAATLRGDLMSVRPWARAR